MKKAYKVVKTKRNGDRVSVIIPNWNTLYKVYIHNGIIKTVDSGFLFKTKQQAIEWTEGQKKHQCLVSAELQPKENLEVWEAEYEEIVKEDRIVGALYLVETKSFNDLYKKFKNNFLEMIKAAKSLKQTNPHIEKSFIAKNITLIQKIY